ncbi:HU family DNA-binding protein [bacterium]|nr:HU family DNA-binding protein [bacterium]
MNRDRLASKIANQFNLSSTMSREIIDAVTDLVMSELKAGNEVGLVGFGRFTIRNRVARRGRNPQTGSTLALPETKTVGFVPSKSLRTELNLK